MIGVLIRVLCLVSLAMTDSMEGYNYHPESLDFDLGAQGFMLRGSISADAEGGQSSSGLQHNARNDIIRKLNSLNSVKHEDGAEMVTTKNIQSSNSNEHSVSNTLLQNSLDFSSSMNEFNKEFYTFTAPEEEFRDHTASQRIAQNLKKSLRVIFIKSPENQALTNAALQLAKQASMDRTAIYVLNKQTDFGELASKLQSVHAGNTHKPEVHFVKYRTQEDATRAQQTIQAQYDALGGDSHSSNEGVAPVLDFTSKARHIESLPGHIERDALHESRVSLKNKASIGSSYLPPSLRLKK